jgi:DNA polymerase-4
MDVYKETSTHIREIFSRYTNLIEPLSLDEAYLDVTDATMCQGSATLIAKKIRADIFNELNLTASAGIAPNKFLAKIASDENKPNGQCVITPDKVAKFVDQLSLKKFLVLALRHLKNSIDMVFPLVPMSAKVISEPYKILSVNSQIACT